MLVTGATEAGVKKEPALRQAQVLNIVRKQENPALRQCVDLSQKIPENPYRQLKITRHGR